MKEVAAKPENAEFFIAQVCLFKETKQAGFALMRIIDDLKAEVKRLRKKKN